MSTLDVVDQVGGTPANFLDVGGGADADKIVTALEVILSDPKVRGDPVQHLRRHHPLRRGREGHPGRARAARRSTCRSSCGWTARTTSRAASCWPTRRRPNVHRRADDARRGPQRVVELAKGALTMAILVERGHAARGAGHHGARGHVPHAPQPRLRHAGRRRRHARQGRLRTSTASRSSTPSPTPSRETGANTSMVFVPPRFAADAIYEAADAGVDAGRLHRRGHPGPRHARRLHLPAAARHPPARAELPGRALAGPRQRRHHPGAGVRRRAASGLVSRSGTLTYQIGAELAQLGLGNSTIVGIGGDPVVGTSLHRRARAVPGRRPDRDHRDGRRDRRQRGGEGGRLHRRARHEAGVRLHRRLHRAARQDDGPRRARSSPARPAPRAAKKEALEARGVRVGTNPTEVARSWCAPRGARR